MKLLFVSMSTRVIYDDNGNIYLNSHMNRKTIKRYSDICSELRMVLRDSNIRCSEDEAKKKYDIFPRDLTDLRVAFNPYSPKRNIFNIKKYKELNKIIEESVCWADRVIVSSPVGVYADITIKYCKKYNKKYMLLVGGFAFETDWNHGIDGKLVAWKHEKDCIKNMKNAPYALYVTQSALQDRYPCDGNIIGCSDVEISDLNPKILEKRLIKWINKNDTIRLGTIANVDDKLKGHRFVIKALSLLKRKGYGHFEYYMLGGGSGERLIRYAKECGVKDQVFFDGAKPHNEVYDWLDNIDIYIQPSFSEGLPRAVIEAMSRACPIICTDVGGNRELCSEKYMIRKGSSEDIVEALIEMIQPEEMRIEAEKSFKKVTDYYYEVLDKRRNDFLKEFVKRF